MCIKKKKFFEICEMFPKSAKILKYKAYLRRKFVRENKEKISKSVNRRGSKKSSLKSLNMINGNFFFKKNLWRKFRLEMEIWEKMHLKSS